MHRGTSYLTNTKWLLTLRPGHQFVSVKKDLIYGKSLSLLGEVFVTSTSPLCCPPSRSYAQPACHTNKASRPPSNIRMRRVNLGHMFSCVETSPCFVRLLNSEWRSFARYNIKKTIASNDLPSPVQVTVGPCTSGMCRDTAGSIMLYTLQTLSSFSGERPPYHNSFSRAWLFFPCTVCLMLHPTIATMHQSMKTELRRSLRHQRNALQCWTQFSHRHCSAKKETRPSFGITTNHRPRHIHRYQGIQ